MKKIAVASVGVALALLAGCSPTATTSPTVTVVGTGPGANPSSAAPSPLSCPGTPGATPTPCTPAQAAELAAKAALYAEAEQVYRRFFEEDGKLTMKGQAASAEVLALVGGPFAESYQVERQNLLGVTGNGYGEIRSLLPAPAQVYDGSEVAIMVCADGSKYTAFKDGKELGSLGVRESIFYFKPIGGSLRIWWQRSTKVPSC